MCEVCASNTPKELAIAGRCRMFSMVVNEFDFSVAPDEVNNSLSAMREHVNSLLNTLKRAQWSGVAKHSLQAKQSVEQAIEAFNEWSRKCNEFHEQNSCAVAALEGVVTEIRELRCFASKNN